MIKYITLQEGFMCRDENGKKVISTPYGEQSYKIPKWSDPINIKVAAKLSSIEENAPIGIITGLSNMIVLDFDTDLFDIACELNDSLEPQYRCTNIAKSIGKQGGHFMYRYESNMLTDYINNPNGMKFAKLDVLCGNTLVFAATPNNKTKSVVVASDELIPMPLAMQLLVIKHYQEDNNAQVAKTTTTQLTSKLGFIAERAKSDDEYMVQLLHIITPKRFRALMAKSDKELHELHPDRVPEGNGHNYIVALSGVLMKDPSIEPDLHRTIIHIINNMFSEPLEEKRLASIVERDIASLDYNYNPSWKNETYTFINRNKEVVELYTYIADGAMQYLFYNTITGEVGKLKSITSVIDYLIVSAAKKVSKEIILQKIKEIYIIERPDIAFGNHSGIFNIYRRNREQEVFYEPGEYVKEWSHHELGLPYNESHPRYPKVTLGALTNACGAHMQKFLSFMHRKYKLREHSPLFFVFYGVPHSFKSAVVNGVFSKLSANRFISIRPEVMLEKFNAWQINKDLVLMDEMQYVAGKELSNIIKNINEISGNKTISGVRKMHAEVDTKVYHQELTFILATNEALQLTNEVNDRRMVVFKATKKVSDALGMTNLDIMRAIEKESVDFAYYLATQVVSLDHDSYLTNESWKTDKYAMFQEEALRLEDKFAKGITLGDIDYILDIFLEAGGSLEKFAKAITICKYKTAISEVAIRLSNSRPDLACIPGILDEFKGSLDMKRIHKKLSLVEHVRLRRNDTVNGTYSGNKKAFMALAKSKLGNVLERLNIANIQEITEIKDS